jgi:hypothetical protein
MSHSPRRRDGEQKKGKKIMASHERAGTRATSPPPRRCVASSLTSSCRRGEKKGEQKNGATRTGRDEGDLASSSSSCRLLLDVVSLGRGEQKNGVPRTKGDEGDLATSSSSCRLLLVVVTYSTQGGIGGGERSLMGRRTSSGRDVDSGCWRGTAMGTMVDRRRLFYVAVVVMVETLKWVVACFFCPGFARHSFFFARELPTAPAKTNH